VRVAHDESSALTRIGNINALRRRLAASSVAASKTHERSAMLGQRSTPPAVRATAAQ
jgi:hypothetical protein